MSIVIPNEGFATLVAAIAHLRLEGNQNKSRHYSETFSKGLAVWLRGQLLDDERVHEILTPEATVPTCFGKKSLDVGCLDKNNYLALDISIKTFNFRDGGTGRYTHNFTGRFYELLGEGLDLRLSYEEAVLAALIFLPIDSCNDGTARAASSFGNAVKQFNKIAARGNDDDHALSFEHVFIGLYDPTGVSFFDARTPPPFNGEPPASVMMSTEQMLERLLTNVVSRESRRARSTMNIVPSFVWAQ